MDLRGNSKNSSADSSDFRTVLLREFSIRQSKNARYSLRGFAKALNLSPSSLSALLRSKRRPTPALIQRVGPELGLSESQIAHMISASGEVVFQEIPNELYEQISDWHHYAILELTKLKKFKSTTAFVANSLLISEQEARLAVDRLSRVGLLDTSVTPWKDLSLLGNATNIANEVSTASKKKLQKQLLEKGIHSLENVPFELRLNRSSTVAINKADLPKAQERIIKFYRKLMADLEETRTATDVYNISIALFPLTHEVTS